MSAVGLTRAACLICATCSNLKLLVVFLFFFANEVLVPISCLLDDEIFGESVNIEFSSLKF